VRVDEHATGIWISAIVPLAASPVVCPRCGVAPVLEQDAEMSRFACRSRWFGLRRCYVGPLVLEGTRDGVYAWNAAAQAWNAWVANRA
jgi:hypothetical protein